VFERFTDRARRVLVLAQEEARLLNHSFIGTEHILLGLIHEHDGIAAQALERCGITLQAVRIQVEEIIGQAGTPPAGSPPLTPRAKKVLELSLREASQLGHSHIGTEHLLLGLIREGEGVWAKVIEVLGVDPDNLYNLTLALMSGNAEDVEGSAITAARRGMPVNDPPRCPQCGARLVENARYRVLTVPAEDPESARGDVEVRVLFCSRCGTPFGSA
jgi:ATP-dependent Clp protease ATP-binding subunit ClpC